MSLNLASLVFKSAKKHPTALALACGITYQDLVIQISNYAAYLVSLGLEPGDRVALMSENRPEFTVAYFAILSMGGVVVPVNTLLSGREIVHCIDHVQCAAFICSVTFQNLVQKSLLSAKTETRMIHLPLLAGSNRHQEQTDSTANKPFVRNPFEPNADDTAVIFFTSGTTGQPKGAELTHSNLHSNALWVSEKSLANRTGETPAWGQGHCTLAVLALSHSFGQTCMQNAPLLSGGCVSYMPKFDARKLLQQIIKDRVTILAAVPRMITELLNAVDGSTEQFTKFQYCLVGGATIDQEIVKRFEDRFQVSVLEGYGLSETSPVIAFRTPAIPRKAGSVGRSIGGVEIQIVDDADHPLDAGQVGEIVVRGHAVMKGYYEDAGATNATIKGGWLHTGDLGYMDTEGDVYIVDRKKDVIIRNGYNVYPAEVEAVLGKFPGVIEVAVVGEKDARNGEEVKAFVVGDFDLEELQKFGRDQLAAYKYPRHIERVSELPKGHKGQILRRELRS